MLFHEKRIFWASQDTERGEYSNSKPAHAAHVEMGKKKCDLSMEQIVTVWQPPGERPRTRKHKTRRSTARLGTNQTLLGRLLTQNSKHFQTFVGNNWNPEQLMSHFHSNHKLICLVKGQYSEPPIYIFSVQHGLQMCTFLQPSDTTTSKLVLPCVDEARGALMLPLSHPLLPSSSSLPQYPWERF